MRTTLFPLLAAALVACGHDPIGPTADLPIDTDTARVRVIIPDAWELANIILAETNYGLNDRNLIWKQGEYYQRVRAHFDRHRTHGSMKRMQLEGGDPLRRMYEFRENSLAWGFVDGKLVHGKRYESFWRPDRFKELWAEVQAFADASDFLAFYAANAAYYRAAIERYKEMVEPDSMAAWLEREFARHYDRYTVAISPLIYGSHSASGPHTRFGNEALMFVSGPDITGNVTPGVQRASMQRAVFTEIDHMFVNPVTDLYRMRVEQVFAERAKWTTDNSSFYTSPRSVFNEYMTWAVFFLFLDGRVSSADFDEMFTRVNQQMEQSRRFIKFGVFNRALLDLWRSRAAGTRARDLYPAILEWAAQQ